MCDDLNNTPQEDAKPQSFEGTPEPQTQDTAQRAPQNEPHPNYGYPYASGQMPGSQPTGTYTQPNQTAGYTAGYAPVPPVPPKKKKKKTGLIVFLSILGACVLISIIGVIFAAVTDGKPHTNSPDVSADIEIGDSPIAPTKDENGALTAKGVYEKVKDASVGVLVYKNSSFSNTSLAGQGSGVIVGEDKTHTYTYVVTCAHVINGGETVKVQLHDETQYDAVIVGYDSRTDIGVLRLRVTGLTACEIGDSDKLSVGEPVFAIGNPGGVSFAGSFTDGMVSAISRPVDSEIGYEMLCIQHTAAINPGNSGGALVNAYGQLVGINSSKIAGEGYEGMGFSVPSKTVKEVFDEIVANGYVTNRAKLGIQYFPASSNQMYSMIVGANHLPAGTIVIQSVTTDSDLANQDVQKGDMITKVNGKELDNADILPDVIENANVGDEITLTISRVDVKNNYELHEFEVKVKLIEDKGTAAPAAEPTSDHGFYNPFSDFGFGQ